VCYTYRLGVVVVSSGSTFVTAGFSRLELHGTDVAFFAGGLSCLVLVVTLSTRVTLRLPGLEGNHALHVKITRYMLKSRVTERKSRVTE